MGIYLNGKAKGAPKKPSTEAAQSSQNEASTFVEIGATSSSTDSASTDDNPHPHNHDSETAKLLHTPGTVRKDVEA